MRQTVIKALQRCGCIAKQASRTSTQMLQVRLAYAHLSNNFYHTVPSWLAFGVFLLKQFDYNWHFYLLKLVFVFVPESQIEVLRLKFNRIKRKTEQADEGAKLSSW